MGLSNWAAAAWNEKGEPTIARMELDDLYIELFKTYIAIADEKAWREGEIFIKPWVIHVYEGCMEYRRVRICAARAKSQQGIFFYIYDTKTEKMLLGIGVYGFELVKCGEKVVVDGEELCINPEETWVGIKEETFKEFLEWLKKVPEEKAWHWFSMPKPPEIQEFWYYNQGTLYIVECLSKQQVTDEDIKDQEFRKTLSKPLL